MHDLTKLRGVSAQRCDQTMPPPQLWLEQRVSCASARQKNTAFASTVRKYSVSFPPNSARLHTRGRRGKVLSLAAEDQVEFESSHDDVHRRKCEGKARSMSRVAAAEKRRVAMRGYHGKVSRADKRPKRQQLVAGVKDTGDLTSLHPRGHQRKNAGTPQHYAARHRAKHPLVSDKWDKKAAAALVDEVRSRDVQLQAALKRENKSARQAAIRALKAKQHAVEEKQVEYDDADMVSSSVRSRREQQLGYLRSGGEWNPGPRRGVSFAARIKRGERPCCVWVFGFVVMGLIVASVFTAMLFRYCGWPCVVERMTRFERFANWTSVQVSWVAAVVYDRTASIARPCWNRTIDALPSVTVACWHGIVYVGDCFAASIPYFLTALRFIAVNTLYAGMWLVRGCVAVCTWLLSLADRAIAYMLSGGNINPGPKVKEKLVWCMLAGQEEIVGEWGEWGSRKTRCALCINCHRPLFRPVDDGDDSPRGFHPTNVGYDLERDNVREFYRQLKPVSAEQLEPSVSPVSADQPLPIGIGVDGYVPQYLQALGRITAPEPLHADPVAPIPPDVWTLLGPRDPSFLRRPGVLDGYVLDDSQCTYMFPNAVSVSQQLHIVTPDGDERVLPDRNVKIRDAPFIVAHVWARVQRSRLRFLVTRLSWVLPLWLLSLSFLPGLAICASYLANFWVLYRAHATQLSNDDRAKWAYNLLLRRCFFLRVFWLWCITPLAWLRAWYVSYRLLRSEHVYYVPHMLTALYVEKCGTADEVSFQANSNAVLQRLAAFPMPARLAVLCRMGTLRAAAAAMFHLQDFWLGAAFAAPMY